VLMKQLQPSRKEEVLELHRNEARAAITKALRTGE